MVSRRTRGYKEKGPMAAFGQFMLPLAVIMAIALLYFSMKLFFLTPSETKKNNYAAVPSVSADLPQPAAPVPAAPPKPVQTTQAAKPAAAKPVKTQITAGPVTAQPTAQKPAEVQPKAQTTATQTAPKTAATAAAPVKTTTLAGQAAPAAKPAAAPAASIVRYDVQIGAFSSRDNALQLVQKARGQGYDAYINEAVHNGAPYFRVRVKGPAQKAESQTLSAKLQEQNYPVYVVPIAK